MTKRDKANQNQQSNNTPLSPFDDPAFQDVDKGILKSPNSDVESELESLDAPFIPSSIAPKKLKLIRALSGVDEYKRLLYEGNDWTNPENLEQKVKVLMDFDLSPDSYIDSGLENLKKVYYISDEEAPVLKGMFMKHPLAIRFFKGITEDLIKVFKITSQFEIMSEDEDNPDEFRLCIRPKKYTSGFQHKLRYFRFPYFEALESEDYDLYIMSDMKRQITKDEH